MRVLCFDIGGTNVKYGVIENEQFLEKGLFDTDAHLGKEHMNNKLVNIAKEMKEKYNIEGIGISCAGSVDFENLTTSDHIIAYEYTNTGCVYNSEFIPIKYQNELVGWVIKTAFDGEYIYQFTTAFVKEAKDNLDSLDEFAIIYDRQSSYLYNGTDLIKLGDTAITIDTRAEVSEENLVDAPIVLNNIDANYRLESLSPSSFRTWRS